MRMHLHRGGCESWGTIGTLILGRNFFFTKEGVAPGIDGIQRLPADTYQAECHRDYILLSGHGYSAQMRAINVPRGTYPDILIGYNIRNNDLYETRNAIQSLLLCCKESVDNLTLTIEDS